MFLCSASQVYYLTTYNVFEEALMKNLDLFNELTSIALVDMIIVFSQYNYKMEYLEGDIIFIGILCGNLFVHLFFLVWSTVSDQRKAWRKRKYKKAKKEMKKQKKLGKKYATKSSEINVWSDTRKRPR